MNQEQLAALTTTPLGRSRLSATDIGGPDRTIAYGYTAESDSWHLYLADGQLHVVIYDALNRRIVNQQSSKVWLTDKLMPNKRLYPESTDEHFAHLMRARGHELLLCAFDAGRYTRVHAQAFHALVVDPRTGELCERTDPATPVPTGTPTTGSTVASSESTMDFAFRMTGTVMLHITARSEDDAQTKMDDLLGETFDLGFTTAGGHRITELALESGELDQIDRVPMDEICRNPECRDDIGNDGYDGLCGNCADVEFGEAE